MFSPKFAIEFDFTFSSDSNRLGDENGETEIRDLALSGSSDFRDEYNNKEAVVSGASIPKE